MSKKDVGQDNYDELTGQIDYNILSHFQQHIVNWLFVQFIIMISKDPKQAVHKMINFMGFNIKEQITKTLKDEAFKSEIEETIELLLKYKKCENKDDDFLCQLSQKINDKEDFVKAYEDSIDRVQKGLTKTFQNIIDQIEKSNQDE